MNKNTKKFVVTLLSVLMVLSFMPAMAFAAAPAPGTGLHEWKLDETKSEPATCLTPGYEVYYCTKDGCNITTAQTVEALAPEYPANGVQYTVAEYLDAVIAEGASDAVVTKLSEDLEGKCYLYARSCKKCGKLEKNLGHTGNYVYTGAENHVRPTDKPCAESYECVFCGKTVKDTTGIHDYPAWNADPNKDTVAWNVCPKSNDPTTVDGLNKKVRKCKKCGKEDVVYGIAIDYTFTYYTWSGGYGGHWETHTIPYTKGTPINDLSTTNYRISQTENIQSNARAEYLANHVKHNVKPVDPQPTTAAEQAKYVLYDGQYYEGTETVAPTCSTTGKKELHCPDCDMKLGNDVTVPVTDHNWETKTVAPTCEADGYSIKVCKDCNAVGTKTAGDKATGHEYEQNIVMAPNCEYDGLTIISCKKCGEAHTAAQLLTDGRIEKKNKVYYFKGFKGELYDATATAPYAKCIEVADWNTLGGHKTSGYVDYLAATCTEPAYQARKCQVCNSFIHSTLKPVGEALGHDAVVTVVPATCGAEGYTSSICSRCGKTLAKDGQTIVPEGTVYDKTSPVVAYGAICEYEWVVMQEPTIDEDGYEAYVCPVCGDVAAVAVIPYNTDEKKQEEMEASKPVIEAAAAITKDAAKYTDDSIKAINEAKTNLDTAFSAGTAADVTRAREALQKAVDATVEKTANPMVAKAKTVKAKAKKTTKIAAKKAFTVKKAQGKVTYTKKSGDKKITVSKAGKVTVKKGLKAGKTYKVKVQIKAAGNGNYLAKTKTVTLKVKVK